MYITRVVHILHILSPYNHRGCYHYPSFTGEGAAPQRCSVPQGEPLRVRGRAMSSQGCLVGHTTLPFTVRGRDC